MKFKIKSFIAGLILPAAIILAAGCGADPTPYEVNDDKGYTVSVKYDANGGIFDTNTSVIMDSFNISDMEMKSDGTVDIALLSPDDARRGSSNSFTPSFGGHFLAGWYAERTETQDSDGEKSYVYSKPWDFETSLLTVDADGKYSSSEPVMTLYAAWIPLFKVSFYSLEDGALIDSYSFNPTEKEGITLPKWNKDSGAIDMNDFPKKTGYTFEAAYLNGEGTSKIDGEVLAHNGKVNLENGTAENTEMSVYLSFVEGDIYHIYKAEQFAANYKAGGTYIIHEDLDFSDVIWPSALTTGSFGGKIAGGGHVFKNISVLQNDNSKTSFGLFGQVSETATITDICFETASITIKKGIRSAGSSYGTFAGTVADGAEISGVSFKNSVLSIDTGCYFGTEDYTVGLVCGTGSADIDSSGISVSTVGDKPDRLTVTVNDGTVSITVNE